MGFNATLLMHSFNKHWWSVWYVSVIILDPGGRGLSRKFSIPVELLSIMKHLMVKTKKSYSLFFPAMNLTTSQHAPHPFSWSFANLLASDTGNIDSQESIHVRRGEVWKGEDTGSSWLLLWARAFVQIMFHVLPMAWLKPYCAHFKNKETNTEKCEDN